MDDETHQVVGTDFDPYRTKAKGNQDLLMWLGAGLQPNTGFEPHVVNHPDGRVVRLPARHRRGVFNAVIKMALTANKPRNAICAPYIGTS